MGGTVVQQSSTEIRRNHHGDFGSDVTGVQRTAKDVGRTGVPKGFTNHKGMAARHPSIDEHVSRAFDQSERVEIRCLSVTVLESVIWASELPSHDRKDFRCPVVKSIVRYRNVEGALVGGVVIIKHSYSYRLSRRIGFEIEDDRGLQSSIGLHCKEYIARITSPVHQ